MLLISDIKRVVVVVELLVELQFISRSHRSDAQVMHRSDATTVLLVMDPLLKVNPLIARLFITKETEPTG